MGWTAYSLDGFRGSPLSALKSKSIYFVGSQWQDGTTGYEIIALQPGPGGVYGLVKRSVPGKSDVNIALIIAARTKLDTLYIKVMTEFSFPYYTGMPESLFKRLSSPQDILDQLPGKPIDSLLQWRAAVSARIDNDRVYEALKPGDIVEFKEDIVFDFKPQPVTLRELFVQSAGRSLRFAGRKHDGSLFNCKLRRKTIQENPIVCVR